MDFTQDQLEQAGYQVPVAPIDAWRDYDPRNPVPGYFQFDWLSSRHPDLYHKFALTSVGLMNELQEFVDLTGLDVLDCGAGTGRATLEASRKASRVTAIDVFEAVIPFGREMARQAGLRNVAYVRGNNSSMPFAANSFDACLERTARNRAHNSARFHLYIGLRSSPRSCRHHRTAVWAGCQEVFGIAPAGNTGLASEDSCMPSKKSHTC